jgi:predicted transcriptional regulator
MDIKERMKRMEADKKKVDASKARKKSQSMQKRMAEEAKKQLDVANTLKRKEMAKKAMAGGMSKAAVSAYMNEVAGGQGVNSAREKAKIMKNKKLKKAIEDYKKGLEGMKKRAEAAKKGHMGKMHYK